jgi:hypothetical protein
MRRSVGESEHSKVKRVDVDERMLGYATINTMDAARSYVGSVLHSKPDEKVAFLTHLEVPSVD